MMGNFHTNTMAEPAPETQRVVKASKESRQENLTSDEFKKVLDDQEGTRGEVKKMTGKELEQFRANIAREEAEHQDVVAIEETKGKLDSLRSEIDAEIAAKVPAVGDLEAAPDPTKPKTPFENVKNLFGSVGTSAMGVLVRGWIGVQRMMIDLGLVTGNKDEMKAKVDKIEELYGNWFGAAEMREQMSATLKAGNIEVRKGSQDGLAYNMLKEGYAAWILKKIPERKDAAGKVVPPTEAMINSVKQGAKIEMYLREEATKYKDKFGGPAEPGKKRITTIMGIANGEKPSVASA